MLIVGAYVPDRREKCQIEINPALLKATHLKAFCLLCHLCPFTEILFLMVNP